MGPIRTKLEESLKQAKMGSLDSAVVALAQFYADTLDGAVNNPDVAIKLGPKYLDALKALNMTPSTRPQEKGDSGGGQLGKFRSGVTTARTLPAAVPVVSNGPAGATGTGRNGGSEPVPRHANGRSVVTPIRGHAATGN